MAAETSDLRKDLAKMRYFSDESFDLRKDLAEIRDLRKDLGQKWVGRNKRRFGLAGWLAGSGWLARAGWLGLGLWAGPCLALYCCFNVNILIVLEDINI